jgi:hypothetical protein
MRYPKIGKIKGGVMSFWNKWVISIFSVVIFVGLFLILDEEENEAMVREAHKQDVLAYVNIELLKDDYIVLATYRLSNDPELWGVYYATAERQTEYKQFLVVNNKIYFIKEAP